ncbi:hypothetical protein IFVP408_C2110079 [Vibrio parahaemolyticus]
MWHKAFAQIIPKLFSVMAAIERNEGGRVESLPKSCSKLRHIFTV